MAGGLPLITYAPRGRGGGLLYISIAYYMQKMKEGVQIACKIAYVIDGRPPRYTLTCIGPATHCDKMGHFPAILIV